MSMVQMNTRIPSGVKNDGDEVFRRLNLNSSEIVRLIWTFAAKNKHRPEYVKKKLDGLLKKSSNDRSKKSAFEDAKKLINDIQLQSKNSKRHPIDYLEGKELRDYLYEEKLKESSW